MTRRDLLVMRLSCFAVVMAVMDNGSTRGQGASSNDTGGSKIMPVILRRLLGFILLIATVGLATCQSMVKAEPVNADAVSIRKIVGTQ